jgi:NTP pyrophosphatase (non-canonical NTP hydrolase)
MKFDEYQELAAKYDFFEATEDVSQVGFLEKVLGLVGEAGETADKIKKLIRDKDGVVNEEDRAAVKKELGDTLLYLAGISRYLNVPLSEVAQGNLDKLESRLQRDKLHGEGDER